MTESKLFQEMKKTMDTLNDQKKLLLVAVPINAEYYQDCGSKEENLAKGPQSKEAQTWLTHPKLRTIQGQYNLFDLPPSYGSQMNTGELHEKIYQILMPWLGTGQKINDEIIKEIDKKFPYHYVNLFLINKVRCNEWYISGNDKGHCLFQPTGNAKYGALVVLS